jgi:hypothetical protein
VTRIDNDSIELVTNAYNAGPVIGRIPIRFQRLGAADKPVGKKEAPGKPDPAKGMPDKLVGSWMSPHPNFPNAGALNTYNKDGSFRAQPCDGQGRPMGIPFTGRWEFRDGEIHTVMDNVPVRFHRTKVTWIDNDTIDLQIVETRPPTPVLPAKRYQRLGTADGVASQRRLAMEHACKGDWKAAAAAYAKVSGVQPVVDGELGFEYAAVLLLSGDQAGYRKACAEMLQRSGSLKVRPYHVARVCSLAADSVEDAGLPAKKAATELQQHGQAFWSLTEQGALAYRAGRYNEAATLLEQSLKADDKPARAVLNWLWLALVEHRRGKQPQARVWLDKATKWIEKYPKGIPVAPDEATGLHLHNWLEAQVLRREAEALLTPKK